MNRFILTLFLSLLLSGCVSVKKQQATSLAAREILATETSYDLSTGEIKYTLPEPAMVRIRIGIQNGGPLLRHLVDWEFQKAGPHTETWDKKDESGQVDFSQYKDLLIVLSCVSPNIDPQERRLGAIRGLRKSPKFKIIFPESSQQTAEGAAILQGKTPVRIIVDKKDNEWLSETKYELGMYIDHAYFMEDEEGSNPFTYRFDTTTLNDGIHTITVNITSYQGEIGTATIPVYVKNVF